MDKLKIKKRRFPKEFRKVSNFIKKTQSYFVILGEETTCKSPFEREIIIHHNYDLRKNGLYMLLYECGKLQQPSTFSGINTFKNIDGTSYPQEYNQGKFYSELDAWNRGKKIATNIGISINEKEYDKLCKKHLLKYFTK